MSVTSTEIFNVYEIVKNAVSDGTIEDIWDHLIEHIPTTRHL